MADIAGVILAAGAAERMVGQSSCCLIKDFRSTNTPDDYDRLLRLAAL